MSPDKERIKEELMRSDPVYRRVMEEFDRLREHIASVRTLPDCASHCSWGEDGGWVVHTVFDSAPSTLAILAAYGLEAMTEEQVHPESTTIIVGLSGCPVVEFGGARERADERGPRVRVDCGVPYRILGKLGDHCVRITRPRDSGAKKSEELLPGTGLYT